ncbi:MAG TPA: alpha/beta fold hydrolase [Polyangiaceae bacterium]|nr:alpha/beta fold hydrolase [Polyangiaceae bacterium]
MSGRRADPCARRFAVTRDGWALELFCHSPAGGDEPRRATPVLLVPGYAQTPYLFGVHPRGPSLLATLLAAGFETWTLYLRGTGQSRPRRDDAGPVSLVAYADEDLPAALEVVLEDREAASGRAFVIGSSLGGSVVYGYLARSGAARIAGVVALGSPLRWEPPHPILRALFASPRLAARAPMGGASRLASSTFPWLGRAGWLAPYVNPAHVDLEDARTLVGAVTDPNPTINAEIATWVARRELVLAGTDVAAALRRITIPLLVVAANRDGLVPPAAARSAAEAWGGSDREVLEVGTREDWFAHADLFVAPTAPLRVFAPVARWLAARDPGSPALAARGPGAPDLAVRPAGDRPGA